MAFNPRDDDEYEANESFSGAFRRMYWNEMRSIRSPMFGYAPQEPDPDEDPFARVEAQAKSELEQRKTVRRSRELAEQAAAEEAFAEWLADVRELPEVVS